MEMKRFKLWLVMVAVMVAASMTSCQLGGEKEPEDVNAWKSDSRVSLMLGKWSAPTESDLSVDESSRLYRVFTSEADEESEYYYGYEWDMGDHEGWDDSEGTYEDFLLDKEEGEWHGNGWFKWKLNKNNLSEIEMMSYGWADIPKVYTITVLTAEELRYVDNFKKEHVFRKE